MRNPERTLFFQRIEAVFDGIPLTELSEDDLLACLSVAQYAADMALLEIEERGLVEFLDDAPVIPLILPEGVDPVVTVLTRPRKSR
jgi:hypothetical protein